MVLNFGLDDHLVCLSKVVTQTDTVGIAQEGEWSAMAL